MHSSFNSILDLVFPAALKEYFELVSYTSEEDRLDFYLQEVNIPPSQYQAFKLASKGFYEEITIQDFPIRGSQVFYHIKRRRWLNEGTGQVVFRDWSLVAKGTRITTEFAAFLKEIGRY